MRSQGCSRSAQGRPARRPESARAACRAAGAAGQGRSGFPDRAPLGVDDERARGRRLIRSVGYRGDGDQGRPLYGYTLVYGDVGFTALRKGSGLIDVGTSLDIFKSRAKAQAYEVKALQDLRRVQGMNLQGVVVESAGAFPVRSLGPGAVGLRIVQRVGKKRIYGTAVDFQIDKILCEAVMNRADNTNVDAQVVAIARKLAGRIAGYAQGTLKAQPVLLPRPLGTAKPRRRQGAGSLGDGADHRRPKGQGRRLPAGLRPRRQRDRLVRPRVPLGPSAGIYQLRATAALQRSRREASGRLLVLRSVFTGPEGPATIAQVVGGAGPAKPEGVWNPRVGEESFAVGATFMSRASGCERCSSTSGATASSARSSSSARRTS